MCKDVYIVCMQQALATQTLANSVELIYTMSTVFCCQKLKERDTHDMELS